MHAMCTGRMRSPLSPAGKTVGLTPCVLFYFLLTLTFRLKDTFFGRCKDWAEEVSGLGIGMAELAWPPSPAFFFFVAAAVLMGRHTRAMAECGDATAGGPSQ